MGRFGLIPREEGFHAGFLATADRVAAPARLRQDVVPRVVLEHA